MNSPIWKTRKGTLGTIQEQEFYNFLLEATDPSGGTVSYSIISGSLPAGLVLDQTGRISGVPFEVPEDKVSTFCCRVTSSITKRIADRTFSITITGQDTPNFITPEQRLATTFDGSYVEIQLTAFDIDNEPLRWKIEKGILPNGLTLDASSGIISGFVEPAIPEIIFDRLGWSSAARWDEDPWDNIGRAINKNYEFSISVTDGKTVSISNFSIYVISKDSLTADNDSIIIDPSNDVITSDLDNKHIPIILDTSTDLGVFAHDNYFAYQVKAKDFDNDIIEYSLLVGENIGFDNEINGFDSTPLDFGDYQLPPGLVLSTETGWLYGYIPYLSPAQREYTFGVQVYKKNYPGYISDIKPFKITIVGDINYFVQWTTESNLGEIYSGDISEFSVQATNILDKELFYSLKPGKDGGRLPQGLRLTSNGLIIGQASFETTSFDGGTTFFDRSTTETTVDRKFTFTVRAADREEYIIAFKTFTITLLPSDYQPYESLYLRAYPGLEDKAIYESIVFSNEIIPEYMVYRAGDPYFGKQINLNMLLLSGLKASSATEYIQAMAINHYRKKLKLGSPKVAQALDKNGRVKYEVVYLPIYDENMEGPKSIDLRTKIKRNITTDNNIKIDSNFMNVNMYDRTVYPNGLMAMRKQIRDSIGYVEREILPSWMTSKQRDGRITYWVPGAVLAYLKPGFGDQVKFYLDRVEGFDFKDISFEVDRYIWDNNLSKNFDIETGKFFPSQATTFDQDIRTGTDDLVFVEKGDGSTKIYSLGVSLTTGIYKVEIEKYILLSDSSLALNRTLLVENEDYTVTHNGITNIVFAETPDENSTIYITYTSNQLLEVDAAVVVPFNKIDRMSIEYIDNVLGGLDNIIQNYENKKIIFAQQEQYPGYIEDEDGWIRNLTTWDNDPWSDGTVGFDDYEIIPGYDESQDGSTLNQRAGIWIITIKDGNLELVFDQEVQLNQRVKINSGARYGGKILRLGPLINFAVGETVPRFNEAGVVEQGNPTIFDNNFTRFVEGISIYADPDQGDKYLMFPRVNIFA